jgi:hypothetical protein
LLSYSSVVPEARVIRTLNDEIDKSDGRVAEKV